MTQTPTNPEPNNWWYGFLQNHRLDIPFSKHSDLMDECDYCHSEFENFLEKEVLKARLDELNKIYGATSYREIVDRRADLKKQLGSK